MVLDSNISMLSQMTAVRLVPLSPTCCETSSLKQCSCNQTAHPWVALPSGQPGRASDSVPVIAVGLPCYHCPWPRHIRVTSWRTGLLPLIEILPRNLVHSLAWGESRGKGTHLSKPLITEWDEYEFHVPNVPGWQILFLKHRIFQAAKQLHGALTIETLERSRLREKTTFHCPQFLARTWLWDYLGFWQ